MIVWRELTIIDYHAPFDQGFTHSQWEIISPVSSLKNLPFPIATEQKCSKKVPDSHRREFRVISFEIQVRV